MHNFRKILGHHIKNHNFYSSLFYQNLFPHELFSNPHILFQNKHPQNCFYLNDQYTFFFIWRSKCLATRNNTSCSANYILLLQSIQEQMDVHKIFLLVFSLGLILSDFHSNYASSKCTQLSFCLLRFFYNVLSLH